MKTIATLPVYSRLAEAVPVEIQKKLPPRWSLSQHQVDTYRALTQTDGPDVVFNVAMTGDGKSLAGQLPSLVEGWKRPLFAMYPTNELIRDQHRQAALTWRRWHQYTEAVKEIDSAVLDDLMDEGDFSTRGDALMSLAKNHDVVLTNPDIFHYIMQLFYRRQGKTGDTPDKLIGPLVNRYQQFTFDEFHVFETPQVISVMNALLLIHQLAGTHRRQFLFQSATPNQLLLDYLKRAGLSVQIIHGEYIHMAETPDPKLWRRILHGSAINFSVGAVEIWLDSHLEDTLIPFFVEHRPAAKGAVIVNSVAQAKRVVERLTKALKPHGLEVGENTGFTSRSRRAISYDCDVLVGTSTVDVGVDFQINFLLFESRDAGSFLQRLGRLGRHNSFTKDGIEYLFSDFQAHAVLPQWSYEALFEGRNKEPAPLIDGMETNRAVLAEAIRWAFPSPTDFAGYAQGWGSLQSARILKGFSAYTVRGQYQQAIQELAQLYQKTFRMSMNGQFGRLRSLTENQKVLVDEAVSFRGGSHFMCGVLDETEEGAEKIKTYDLFALLANGRLEALTEEDFWNAVDQAGLKRRTIERSHPIGFLRIRGFRPERTNYRIQIERDLMEWGADRFGVATVLTGITVESDEFVPGLNDINRKLERRQLPALICLSPKHPLEWKAQLRLPMLFPLFAFKSRDDLQGIIAFGREALLLDVALRHRGIDCGGGAIIT
ncbi:MAG: type I-D CRISPR-associated helicase Cas3' [Caldilineaceae bacterium]|nr:type I-D CRISPR-associated helicase Cas3' [Caldilineaceae bacterium]